MPSSTRDSDGRLKDICLSYALFRVLCHRFAAYSMSKSYRLKTWNFVRHGLLSKEGDHARAFRVIKVELAFLYDFFYIKYYAFFTMGFPIFKIVQLFIVIINWLGNCCSHSKTLPYTQRRLEPAYSK